MSASASILRLIGNTPVPLFGSLATALAWSTPKFKALPRFAGWTLPLGVGALWFIWPAVDDGWKVSVGILPDPQHAAAAKQPIGVSKEKGQVMDVPADIVAKVTAIHHAEGEGEEDMGPDLVAIAASSGDYSALQAKWETFFVKSTNPGEDDDDEDEEEEEEEEEEAEDDEGEGEDDDE